MCSPAFYQAMQDVVPYVGGDRENDLGLRSDVLRLSGLTMSSPDAHANGVGNIAPP